MTSDPVSDEPRRPREPDEAEVRSAARAQFWKRFAQAAGVAAMVLVLAFSAWTVFLIRDTQVSNRTTLSEARAASDAAAKTAQRIEDCTTPGGDCFERAQRSTSGAIAGINTLTLRATACLAVILKQIPEGTKVAVDPIAQQIQECIRTSHATINPQRVVPAPKSSSRPSSTSSSTPKQPPQVKHHPKAPASTSSTPSPTHPGTPAPTGTTPTAGPTPITTALCDLLKLSPCPLS